MRRDFFVGCGIVIKDDWKIIVERAWSFRLMALAAALTAAEVALPLFGSELSRTALSIASGVVIVAAMVARLMVQKEFSDND